MSMRYGVDATVEVVDESTTPEIFATLVGLTDEAIPGSALDTLTLTYYQEYTQVIINGRNAQNVLQANGVTVDGAGKLLWKMTALDTVILNDSLETEPHIAHFVFTYTSDTPKVGSVTIRIPVANILRD